MEPETREMSRYPLPSVVGESEWAQKLVVEEK